MLDKATDFVKFRNRISLFTKKLRLAQYSDGGIYVHHLKIAQAQLSDTCFSLMSTAENIECVNNQ